MVTQDDLEEWFPEEDIIVVPGSAFPDGLANVSARTFLSEVGLPESLLDVVEFDPKITKRVRPVAEVYRSHDEDPPDGTSGLFYLGFAGQPFVCVDGGSGAVVQVHREFGVRPLASGLDTFVSTLGFANQEVEKFHSKGRKGADKFAVRLREGTMKHLRTVDPGAAPGAEPAWASVLDDIAATSI